MPLTWNDLTVSFEHLDRDHAGLDAAENENHADVLSAYIALYPLVGKEIIDLWINDGSQFGRRPALETAQAELEQVSLLLS